MAVNDWGDVLYGRHHLLTRIGLEHDVLYSSGGKYSWEIGRRPSQWRPLFGRFERHGAITVDITPRVPFRLMRWLAYDRWAVMRLAARLQRRWDRRFGRMRVLWLFNPEFWPYVDHLRFDVLVYHAYDLYRCMPGWSDALASYERMLCERADVRLATSKVLADALTCAYGKPFEVITNGVDYEAYATAMGGAAPVDVAHIARPRLGYIGTLNRKVDFELIRELAAARPDWQFALIGEVRMLDEAARAEEQRCRGLANVHFLGAKPQSQMPAYVASLDVGLIPYRMDESWIEAGNPLKLYEYLAAGIPAVCCRMPSIQELGDLVRCPDRSAEGWATAIAEALAEPPDAGRARRQATARERDWNRLAGRALAAVRSVSLG
jgi:glycosyltransferase involved in cell wall biosynthesis